MSCIKKSQTGLGKITVVIAIAVVCAAAISILLYHAQKKEPIRIGAVLSISGPASFYGKEVRDGLLLAIDELNTWGGINGRKIEMIIKDSKTNIGRRT